MAGNGRTRLIHRRTSESAAMVANVKRAMAITAMRNRLRFDDNAEVRALFSKLLGRKVDESFVQIPPFYTAGGDEIRVGRNAFVNQSCTFFDLGGLDIGDEVLIGPGAGATGRHRLSKQAIAPILGSDRRAARGSQSLVGQKTPAQLASR